MSHSKLLLVDAGNTRVKWALVDNAPDAPQALGEWPQAGRVEHAQLGQLVSAWRGKSIARVLLSNVAGESVRDAIEQVLFQAIGMQPVPLVRFVSVPELGGIRNAYRDPSQLGCDRFASAIGAHALFPGEPLLIVTSGTATTIDALTADGVFLGGMILPGLGLMASSLARNTAQLPQVAATLDVANPFADHTDAAIASGCIAAQTGAIKRGHDAHLQRSRASNPAAPTVRCILSGGAAPLLTPHLPVPHTHVENLVLIGLHQVSRHHPV